MEKIDIHRSERNYELARKKLLEDESILASTRMLILSFLDDRSLGKVERREVVDIDESIARYVERRKSKLRSSGTRTLLKNLYCLKVPCRFFQHTELSAVSIDLIERFVSALETGKLVSEHDTPFSEPTKTQIKKSLIQFLRWYFGQDSKQFHKLTYWIDTTLDEKEVATLSEREVLKIIELCGSVRQKVLIACLFDGGFRIEEFLNVRNRDVELIEGPAPYFRIEVREEFSKTKGRVVTMYWTQCFDIISQWLTSRTENIEAHAPFFPATYGGVRMMLSRLGNRFGKRIYPHLFRHSSATFYALKGWNEFKMNYRYGWSKHSDMGRHYVEAARIREADIHDVRQYEIDTLGEVRHKLDAEVQEKREIAAVNAAMKEKYSAMEEELAAIKEMLELFVRKGAERKSFTTAPSPLRDDIRKNRRLPNLYSPDPGT